MSSGKHTPGPWSVGSNGGHIETANTWRLSIAICYSADTKADGVSKEEFQANARLIAAAPEILEALHELYVALEIDGCAQPFQMQKALAAIAKATGATNV